MKKLCMNNEYLIEFKSEIKSAIKNSNGTYSVILKETYFYPESGGQLFDKGYIGEGEVLNVMIINEDIVHITDKYVEGKNVICKIDWPRRFDHMQQHTGQHIISGILENQFGIKTLSFHMGKDNCSIETDKDTLTNQIVHKLEILVNDTVVRNLIVRKYYSEKEDNELDIRKKIDIDGKKRIVEIANIDKCYCGGTHINYTGEIGLIKITGIDKTRKNIRLHFKCGKRALSDYSNKHKIITNLKRIMTRDENGLVEGINQLILDNKKLNRDLKKYRLKEIEELSKTNRFQNNYIGIIDTYSDDEIKYLQSLLFSDNKQSVIANRTSNRIFISLSEDKDPNTKILIDNLRNEYGIKGGGNKGKYQLLTESNTLNDIIERLRLLI